VILVCLDISTQGVEPMTSARIRALTREAQSKGGADKTEIVLGLDARVRALWGDFESFPVSVVRRDDLSIDALSRRAGGRDGSTGSDRSLESRRRRYF
jgi:hypothetical protein